MCAGFWLPLLLFVMMNEVLQEYIRWIVFSYSCYQNCVKGRLSKFSGRLGMRVVLCQNCLFVLCLL